MKETHTSEDALIPAVPPSDYTGTITDWIITLNAAGLLDGNEYETCYVKQSMWWDILHHCEAKGHVNLIGGDANG